MFNKYCKLVPDFKKIILLIFSIVHLSVSGQDAYMDSLKHEIKTSKQDTVRADALNNLGELIYAQYPDSAIIFWQKAVKLCSDQLTTTNSEVTTKAFSLILSRSLMNCGTYYQSSIGPDEGLKYFNRALEVSTKNDHRTGVADCLLSIGNVYTRKGDILQALEYYHRAVKIYEKITAPNNMAYCLGNIGNLYTELGDLENALIYLNRCAKIYEKQKYKSGVAFALNGISAIYREYGDPQCKDSAKICEKKSKDKALNGYLKTLELWSADNDPSGIANACLNIAAVYRLQMELDKALEYATRSFTLYQSLNNKQGVGAVTSILASIMFDRGNLKSAEEYASVSMKIGKELGNLKIISSVSGLLKKVYEKQNKFKDALEMQELSVKMRDSLTNESTRKKSIKKQFEVEYAKQAERDSILNTIKIAEEQFKHEQAISQQRVYTFGGIIGFVLMLFVAIVSYRAFKTKQKANTIITQQSAKIEIANKDLQRQHVLNQKIFSVISHDFRGPILSLNLVLNRFKDSSTNEKLNSYLKDIGTSVHNANAVLNNLLNWAKTEIEVESFDRSDCKVETVVEKTEMEFSEKLGEKNLQLVKQIPGNAMVGMPHDILQIALRNLLSNAIKFSNRDNKIEIVFDRKGVLSVRDFGVGISPEKKELLFNNQVNAAVGTNKEDGFGIGLYIVSELLYKYGFKISVESEPGQGTVFKIMPK